MKRIAVSVVSPLRLFCDALAAKLAQDERFGPVEAACAISGLPEQVPGPIEIVLLHADSKTFRGETIWQIKARLPAARVIAIGFDNQDAESWRWIEAGAAEYQSCAASYAALCETICAVARRRRTRAQVVSVYAGQSGHSLSAEEMYLERRGTG